MPAVMHLIPALSFLSYFKQGYFPLNSKNQQHIHDEIKIIYAFLLNSEPTFRKGKKKKYLFKNAIRELCYVYK